MALTWAPDYSSFTDDPNAQWFEPRGEGYPESGWGYASTGEGYPWRAASGYTAGGGNEYAALKAAGAWDLKDPNSDTWKYLRTLNNLGDPQTNPEALAFALSSIGAIGATNPADPRWQAGLDRLVSEGLDPGMAQGLTSGYHGVEAAQENPSGGVLGDVLRTGTEMVTQTPLGAALAAYGLHSAGMFPGADVSSASGGATAAPASLESALGPATGTVLEPGLQASGAMVSPVGTAGAPVVSGLATGGGPFISTALGTGLAGTLSKFLDTSNPAGSATSGTGSASSGGTAAGTAAGTAISRVLNGTATGADWLELAGRLGPAALGAFASGQQADAFGDLSDRYMAIGAPSRARFEGSFAPGFSMADEPGYSDALDQTTKSFLHKASIGGNPADSPNAWAETLKGVNSTFAFPALNEYRRLNAGAGGLAALTSAAPAAASSAIGAEKGIYDSIGVGAADVFNPPKSLDEILRQYLRR